MPHERYTANRDMKLGLCVWPVMVRELWQARELIARLFLRSLSARYKQAFLGIAWAVIVPGVAIGTFVFLKRTGIVSIGATDVPYPLFALLGVSLYQLLATGISSSCGALVEAGDMIAKVSFPREVLVIAAIAQAVFEFMVKIVLIALVCVYYQVVPPVGALWSTVAVVPLLCMALGLGLFFSLLNAVFRDTAQALSMILMFAMFLMPILYPVDGAHELFFRMNPLVALIEGPRDLFIYGALRHPTDFFVAGVLSVLVCLIAWRIFHLVETKIPERL
ncbi:MAG: ABC transporter permease [Candidatus Omnitrophica bacterium]|nr:ABC transporter permease [Candidatus Omnitrophota bacterium]